MHRREEYGARTAGELITVPHSIRSEFVIHHEGASVTHDGGVAMMKAIERVHIDEKGWAAVGYNAVVDNSTGEAWEGRGLDKVGAHCPNHNRIGYGVQLHIGGDQDPSPAALTTICDLYAELCRLAGHQLRIMGHRDGYATECPGDKLEAWLKAGMPRPDGRYTPPVNIPVIRPRGAEIPPLFPLPAGAYFGPKSGPACSVSGYYSHREDLRRWQRRMVERGWYFGPAGADGLYGDWTAGVARRFQREKGLTQDGLIGINTWNAAWSEPITA